MPFSILFDQEERLRTTVVWGSQGHMIEGIGATRREPGKCDLGWLPDESTMIVGGDAADRASGDDRGSRAEWMMCVDERTVANATGGYLVIACTRIQGGLHTQNHGALARLYFNDGELDVIGLKDKPAGHTDFFHRPTVPGPRQGWPWPLDGCGTIYSWSFDRRRLKKGQAQGVRVTLDAGVGWDIDYVGLVLIEPRTRLSDFSKNMIYILIGAALSYGVALLTLGG